MNLIFILIIIICLILNYISAEKLWCINGSPTATTEEFICSSHLGYFCKDSGIPVNTGQCQSGYGISFYHRSCENCKCLIDQSWIERRKVALGNRKRQQINK